MSEVTTHMQAATIARPGAVEIHRVPVPAPRMGEVRVRIEGCGVCGSNLALWEGRPWFDYPREPGAPGHEGWGYIDHVGSDVSRQLLHQRVAVLSYKAFADYDIAPVEHVVPLPAVLADKPFPGEALGCAMNIVRRSAIRPGQTVAIVGAGFLGVLLTQLAVQRGAKPIVISRRPFALTLAQHSGAERTIALRDPARVIAQVKEATHSRGCDVVIEAVGAQGPLDLAGELTAERGRLVIAGYHQDPRQVNMQLWNWRGLDVVNAHEREPSEYLQGIHDAVDAVVSGMLDPEPLYTHRFSLHKLGVALNALRERPDGLLKVWVTP